MISNITIFPRKEINNFFTQAVIPDSQREDIYRKAKEIISGLSNFFQSKLSFNDVDLEISFHYDLHTLKSLANHESLWFLFSNATQYNPHQRETILDLGVESQSRFCVKESDLIQSNLFSRRLELAKEANEFFKNHPPSSYSCSPFFHLEENTPENLIDTVFKSSKGLAIGDAHSSICPKYFMISQMDRFASCGVETLFMEGLYETIQQDLDDYFSPDVNIQDLPEAIKHNFGYLEKILKDQNGYTMIDIIQKAKLSGIKRIVGVDTSLAPCADLGNRVSSMNYFAKRIIEINLPKDKFVIFAGGSHTTTQKEGTVPGFDKLFSIPSIHIYESFMHMTQNNLRKELTLTFKDGSKEILEPDFCVGIPKAKSVVNILK